MPARNMEELERMICKEMKKAMTVVAAKAKADIHEETSDFYSQGNPKVYQRTGALGETPKTTSISSSENVVSFNAYLDTSGNYTTGDKPSMTQVLNLANYGKPWVTKSGNLARSTLGKKYFWERSEKKIENTLNTTMGKFFKKN